MVSPSVLQKIALFKGLDRAVLKEIADSLVLETWNKNQEILAPEESARRFMVIVTGRVKVTCSDRRNGREFTLSLLGPGDAFDVVSLFDGEPHAVSTRTLDRVRVLAAPCSLFREWIERYPALRTATLRYAASQLRDLGDLAEGLALHDTMTRLAHLLLRHLDADLQKSSPGSLLDDLSHEELAALIGSVRVVVNRLLAQLRKESTVIVNNGRLQIANVKRLLRHAERHLTRFRVRPGPDQAKRDRKRIRPV